MMKYFLILCLLLLTSCGESPLFNHSVGGGAIIGNNIEGEHYSFKKSNFDFAIDWSAGPSMGESKFLLRTWNKDEGSISGPYQDLPKDLNIYLWMPAMGHGSAPVKITKTASGEYDVSNVYFVMAGKWEIHFELKSKKVVVDEVIIPITL